MTKQRTVIIGDIHGVTSAFQTLLDRLALAEGDHLVLAGDLIDKGPDSPGTVRLARALAEEAPFELSVVEGNHDEKFRRYRRNLEARPGVAVAMAERQPELPHLLDALSKAEADWFCSVPVPFLRLPEHDVVVVHAGIGPFVKSLPSGAELAAGLSGKRRAAVRTLLRTRFVDAETGRFIVLGEEAPEDPFWAEIYDGRFGHAVFGHQPFLDGPAEFAHATGIDTGAVCGGRLTALLLQRGAEWRYESVEGGAHSPYRTKHLIVAPKRPQPVVSPPAPAAVLSGHSTE